METLCKACGHEGPPRPYTAGTPESEMLAWVAALLLALLVHWVFGLGAVAYTGWRLANRYNGCAACRSPRIVPLTGEGQPAAANQPGGASSQA